MAAPQPVIYQVAAFDALGATEETQQIRVLRGGRLRGIAAAARDSATGNAIDLALVDLKIEVRGYSIHESAMPASCVADPRSTNGFAGIGVRVEQGEQITVRASAHDLSGSCNARVVVQIEPE